MRADQERFVLRWIPSNLNVETRSIAPDEVKRGGKLIEVREPRTISLVLDVLICISLLAVQVSREVRCDGMLFTEPVVRMVVLESLEQDAYVNNQCMVAMYHAHLSEDMLHTTMADFKQANSTIRVVVSTVAFGVGIKIPDMSRRPLGQAVVTDDLLARGWPCWS